MTIIYSLFNHHVLVAHGGRMNKQDLKFHRKHNHLLQYLLHNLIRVRDLEELAWFAQSIGSVLDTIYEKFERKEAPQDD